MIHKLLNWARIGIGVGKKIRLSVEKFWWTVIYNVIESQGNKWSSVGVYRNYYKIPSWRATTVYWKEKLCKYDECGGASCELVRAVGKKMEANECVLCMRTTIFTGMLWTGEHSVCWWWWSGKEEKQRICVSGIMNACEEEAKHQLKNGDDAK